ncbi:hypothetical protein ACWHA3_01005 [Streptomyces cyaneofuscatus]
MKVRSDIADMLRAGAHQQDIMRTLHVGAKLVVAHREALRLPPPRRGGRPLLPIAAAYEARTEPEAGGHLRWTGHVDNGVPKLVRNRTKLSAYRVAFRMAHGREPVGQVRPGCGYPRCVAGDHMEDRPMREQLQAQLAGIFGGAL